MNALVIGGTGLIGVGIVRRLLERGADVTVFSRGTREDKLPTHVKRLIGDRSEAIEFETTFHDCRYDVVIDMTCFTVEHAESTVRTFAGRCEHLEFCSTVCTYGGKVSESVLIDEAFPQEPLTAYGAEKLACERIFERAAAKGAFKLTILRPSHTYGPGGALVDQLELDGVSWDRIVKGFPILCAADGLGLWQSTHRDDCGKLFAYAALNPKTYGEAYNATGDAIFTWRDHYRKVAAALDTRARLVFVPAGWILAARPGRFSFLRDTTRFHGAYTSAKARDHVPQFRATIDLESGARETLADVRRRGAWRDCSMDEDYARLVDEALRVGFEAADA